MHHTKIYAAHFAKPLQRNRNRNRSQVDQRNKIAIREQYAQQQQEKKLERKCQFNMENQNRIHQSQNTIATRNHNKQSKKKR